jgi:hypothetical protein
MTAADWVGSAGVTLLLVAFALNNRGALAATSGVYLGMNAVGAALACTASFLLDYWPFVVLEGSWCLVALASLATGRAAGGSGPGP